MARRTRVTAHRVVGLVWAIMAFVVGLPAVFVLVMIGTWFAMQGLGVPRQDQNSYIGFAGGSSMYVWAYLVGAVRRWVHRLRLWWTRRHGITTIATLTAFHEQYHINTQGPGLTIYTLQLAWTDADGPHTGDRQYRFWGAQTRNQQRFLARIDDPGQNLVRYPRGKPHRFLLDIPYAPRMSDQFL